MPDSYEIVTIRVSPAEHKALHKYAKAIGRTTRKGGVGSLIWGLPLRTLVARAIRFSGTTFASPADYAAAVRAEERWVTRTSV